MIPKGFDLDRLSPEQQDELLRLLEDEKRYREHRLLYSIYPDEGPLRRALYPKHMEFFAAGLSYRERCAICANRIGKTFGMGGYEVTLHLTGEYPDWWEGRRFTKPVRVWAAGKTNETTRDIIQVTLLGDVEHHGTRKAMSGTGLVPGDNLGLMTWKAGVADLIDTIKIRHKSGGWSLLGLKSYQQGRGSFEGTAQDVIWLDEEPPMDVYNECLIRTATTNGLLMLTFTPLAGMSEVVKSFRPAADINAEW